MSKRVNLYDNAYANYGSEVYREVRNETYGEDFGQTSWVTNEESKEIPRLLDLKPDSFVLEVGCGSGRYALHLTVWRDKNRVRTRRCARTAGNSRYTAGLITTSL